jgi:hypothetical protein
MIGLLHEKPWNPLGNDRNRPGIVRRKIARAPVCSDRSR